MIIIIQTVVSRFFGFTVCWDGDDNRATGSFSINWRNSPPNTDNFIEIPVRIGSGQYENYIAKIRYRWTLSNPTATITAPLDRTLCIGTPTILTATTTNATWYQWQLQVLQVLHHLLVQLQVGLI
jgi:hypothetical protein